MTPQEHIRQTRMIYRSGHDHLGRDFFEPCLEYCTLYQRAAGYFSSHVLLSWLRMLPLLVCDQTHIQLLISPQLSSDDKEALLKAVHPDSRKLLQQQIADDILEKLEHIKQDVYRGDQLYQLFSWLVANERLEVKLAFPHHVEHSELFHEKIGLFHFPWDEKIAFTGSANETSAGHERNYESLDVFRSWIPGDQERVRAKCDQFTEAWQGRARGLRVVSPSLEILDRITEQAPTIKPTLGGAYRLPAPELPPNEKWRHQRQALERFLEVRAGVLEMATGTGKTRTALSIVRALKERDEIDGVIISTIGNDLLDQWGQEVTEHIGDLGLVQYRHYHDHHELGRFASHPENSLLIVSRGQLKSLFQRLPPEKRRRLLIIHDEVHGLGSANCVRDLVGEHQHFGYRLGLSATPEREYDEVGTEFITRELGKVFFFFGLEDAIKRGILCEFDYLALNYELTEGDRDRLRNVYKMQAARKAQGQPMSQEEVWLFLAAVYKTAEQKPEVFKTYLKKDTSVLKSSIIFVHEMSYGDLITSAIHRHTSNYSTYYSDDAKKRLIEFSQGRLDCLITCHRLSQGVDIRHLRCVVLLSSDRARLETIQRIGRCLRIDPTNLSKRALVLDFVLDNIEEDPTSADAIRFAWLSQLAAIQQEE